MSHKFKYLLVYSKKDIAGTLIADIIRKYVVFDKFSNNLWINDHLGLLMVNEDIIFTDNFEASYGVETEAIIFLSRHSSVAKIKTLSVHVSGNPSNEAEYGGRPRKLAPSHPILMKSILSYLNQLAIDKGLNKEYTISLEVTHHGPTEINAPSLFVEVGSSIDEWKDVRACTITAEAVLTSIDKPIHGTPCIGFGGPHYAPTFTKKVIEDEYAAGHIFSKYVVHEVDINIIMEAVQKTMNANIALLDWKGMKGMERQRIKNLLEKINVKYIKV